MKKFRELVEQKDTVVFTFGRFNPPTTGHEKLIQKVKSVAGSQPFRIYPSFSQNQKKDPLPHALKIAYMRKMFSRFAKNIVADKNSRTAIDIAVKLYDEGFKNLTMVVGSDRVKEFQRLLSTYNGVGGKRHGYYKFDSINVVSAGERDPDAEGVEGMSASKMRGAAVEGDFDSFRMGTPPSLSDSDTKKLFNDIRKGMRLEVVKEGSKWKNIDFNYREMEEKDLTENDQITYENYTSKNIHNSFPAYDFFDEICNSMGYFSKKKSFYIKECLIITDKFLEIREKALKENKINQYDFHELEILGKKHFKFMEKMDIDHLDNSFIYKYISEIKEYLEWGDYKSLEKYTKDTPGQDETVQEGLSKVSNFLKKKLDIPLSVADKIIQRAAEKGIDILKIQSRWSMLGPSILALVSEYKPQEKENG